MNKINLGIIFGGESSEYSVSLHSTASAIRHIDQTRFNIILIGIDESGHWYHYDGNVEHLEHDEWKANSIPAILSTNKDQSLIRLTSNNEYDCIKLDCVLPIVHGTNGEDGTLQGLLKLADIPFVGCDHLASAMSMDKEITHIICEANDILMADYCAFNIHNEFDYEKAYKDICDKLDFPIFIKPANAGSSYGITKVNEQDFDIVKQALVFASDYDKKVIVETGISGFEVGCAVMGNDYDSLTMGAIDEIDTNKDFFDFDAKYELADTKIVCPARISDEQVNQVKTIAGNVYRAMGCSGLARVDMFVADNGEIYLNELNTIPGFTDTSRYPSMMKAIGIDFTTLITKLVDLALEKRG